MSERARIRMETEKNFHVVAGWPCNKGGANVRKNVDKIRKSGEDKSKIKKSARLIFKHKAKSEIFHLDKRDEEKRTEIEH